MVEHVAYFYTVIAGVCSSTSTSFHLNQQLPILKVREKQTYSSDV